MSSSECVVAFVADRNLLYSSQTRHIVVVWEGGVSALFSAPPAHRLRLEKEQLPDGKQQKGEMKNNPLGQGNR